MFGSQDRALAEFDCVLILCLRAMPAPLRQAPPLPAGFAAGVKRRLTCTVSLQMPGSSAQAETTAVQGT